MQILTRGNLDCNILMQYVRKYAFPITFRITLCLKKRSTFVLL